MTVRRVTVAYVPALVVLLLAACDSATAPGSPAPQRITELPRSLSVAETEAIAASNEFAFRLLREVRVDEGPHGNVFISPLSVSVALGMTANGARGETLEAIQETLGLDHLDRTEMNEAYRGLHDLLVALDPQVELGLANSLWLRDDWRFRSDFIERVETSFGAEVREVDIQNAPGSVLDIVNAWVEEETNGRIPRILEEVKPEDLAYLINAVYFDGAWRSRFDPAQTEDETFHLADDGTVEVPMMTQEGVDGRLHRTTHPVDVVIGELPYGGDAFSMVVVVPISATLDELLESLTSDVWAHWMEGLYSTGFDIELPRFEVEYGTELEDALTRIGMGIAFKDSGRSDFGDMVEVPLTPGKVYIDRVDHRTFLGVDEEGTEAAAATSVVTGFVCDCQLTLPRMTLRADRPFLVAIRERLSGTLLFLGAIYDPSDPGG